MSSEEEFDLEQKIRELRVERYALQSIAKKALEPIEFKTKDKKARVAHCLRRIQKKDGHVTVHQHRKTNKAFYSGLSVCGSVWQCPVCASKISEKRRKELNTAFQTHKSNGGKIVMLTLTFKHKRTDKLSDILEAFNKAQQTFYRGKAFDKIREEMAIIGRIRALEVTWRNENGFHPHSHSVIFFENDIDEKELEKIKKRMYKLWKAAAKKQGLSMNEAHGLDLQGAEKASDYIAKHGNWSLDQEMTKAHIKKGKENSLTPFDFLREYMNTENPRYLKLFQEYVVHFHGKNQLWWSDGLKKKFIIEEKKDEDLAKEKTEEADVLGHLDWDQWKMVLSKDARGEFLNVVEQMGIDFAVKTFCSNHNDNNTNDEG